MCAICQRTQLAPSHLLVLPPLPHTRRAPDVPTTVQYRVGAKALGHEGHQQSRLECKDETVTREVRPVKPGWRR